MVSAIIGLLSSLPKLLELTEKFASWLMAQIELAKKKKAIDDLAKAVEKAKKEKDTSNLDDLFGGK